MCISRIRRPRQWAEHIRSNAGRIANHRWALGLVFLLEFAGCTFLPLPIALLMVGLVTAAPARWLRFAFGATAGSIAGGILLYVIGRAFFHSVGEPLINFYGVESQWAGVVEWFNSEWGLAFVLLAGITTGLFRIASIGAGFTVMNPLAFFAVLSLSRAARWVAECGTIKYLGDRIKTWPRHYYKYATAGAALLVLVTLLALSLAT
jgi:membrane protein YqaA with SNARE-associated domain